MSENESFGQGFKGRSKKSLKGEDWWWFIIAERLKKSVQKVKNETTATEFFQWQAFLEKDLKEGLYRNEPYLQRICFEIYQLRKAWSKDLPDKSFKDFHIDFAPNPTEEQPMLTAEEKKEDLIKRANQSERAWRMIAKLAPAKKGDKPPPGLKTPPPKPKGPNPLTNLKKLAGVR